MDLLRMVINEQKNTSCLLKALSLITKSKGYRQAAWVRMENALRKSERVNQRREKIYSRLTVLELRMDELVEKVQRLKTKYNVMD